MPRRDKLLPYTLCENHRNERRSFEGECIYGRQCKQPHSKWELASWEAERETGNLVAVRLYDVSECKLKLCKDVTWGMGRGVARGVPITGHCCGGERCRYAHSKEELEEWIRKCMQASWFLLLLYQCQLSQKIICDVSAAFCCFHRAMIQKIKFE